MFLDGLLTSQNVVYFVAITLLFLCFTILKLWLGRYHYPVWRKVLYYVGILSVIVFMRVDFLIVRFYAVILIPRKIT